MYLFLHGSRNFVFENCGKVVFLHQDFAETLQIQVRLIFIPQKHVFEPAALELQIEFDWNQLQIWLDISLLNLGRLFLISLFQ